MNCALDWNLVGFSPEGEPTILDANPFHSLETGWTEAHVRVLELVRGNHDMLDAPDSMAVAPGIFHEWTFSASLQVLDVDAPDEADPLLEFVFWDGRYDDSDGSLTERMHVPLGHYLAVLNGDLGPIDLQENLTDRCWLTDTPAVEAETVIPVWVSGNPGELSLDFTWVDLYTGSNELVACLLPSEAAWFDKPPGPVDANEPATLEPLLPSQVLPPEPLYTSGLSSGLMESVWSH